MRPCCKKQRTHSLFVLLSRPHLRLELIRDSLKCLSTRRRLRPYGFGFTGGFVDLLQLVTLTSQNRSLLGTFSFVNLRFTNTLTLEDSGSLTSLQRRPTLDCQTHRGHLPLLRLASAWPLVLSAADGYRESRICSKAIMHEFSCEATNVAHRRQSIPHAFAALLIASIEKNVIER